MWAYELFQLLFLVEPELYLVYSAALSSDTAPY